MIIKMLCYKFHVTSTLQFVWFSGQKLWNFETPNYYSMDYLIIAHIKLIFMHEPFYNIAFGIRPVTNIGNENQTAASHNSLTLPMLRLLSSKGQGGKDFWKTLKPCHVVIHCIALAEYSQMSTHMPWFQSFFRFFVLFCIGQISHQQHKG